MENNTKSENQSDSREKPKYKVTFDDGNEFYSTDSAEGIHSEEDELSRLGKTITNNLSKTSSAIGIGGQGGDMQSASSISTSILDDVEEIKVLKKKLVDLETRNKLLDFEIEKVNLCLINERTKTTKLERKLQFVKDNQDVFIKLKEAYINMKYNEAAGRKMVEIREKGLQTWEGILCRGCIDAEQLRRQMESFQQTYKDSYIITPFQLEQLLRTVKYLKDLVERREATWSDVSKRDEKLKEQLNVIQHENTALRELIQTRELRSKQESTPEHDRVMHSDLNLYKKIIIKYEKKLRDLEKSSHGLVRCNIPFNDKEKKSIQCLMSKYLNRFSNKTCRSLSRVGLPKYKCGRAANLKTRSEMLTNQEQNSDATPLNPNEVGRTLKVMNFFLESNEYNERNKSDNSRTTV